MVTIIGNGLGDPISNPGQGCLHFTCTNTLGKGIGCPKSH